MADMIYTPKTGKKIVFDCYEDNTKDYHSYWAKMCPHCYRKYRGILGQRADEGGTAGGTCYVKGCTNQADYYIDFSENEVQFA